MLLRQLPDMMRCRKCDNTGRIRLVVGGAPFGDDAAEGPSDGVGVLYTDSGAAYCLANAFGRWIVCNHRPEAKGRPKSCDTIRADNIDSVLSQGPIHSPNMAPLGGYRYGFRDGLTVRKKLN